MKVLSAAASAKYDAINTAGSREALDDLGRLLWEQWGRGELGDDEAMFLNAAIDERRPLGRRHANLPEAVTMKPVGRLNGRLGSPFTPRQRPRSPNRKASRDRRRRLGGSSALPDALRHHYTEGQRAVLCIVSGEVKHHGVCDLPIDKIAALAGVCRTTVQTTLHGARRLGHIRITERPVTGRKHLTNLIEITSTEWRAWLKRGPYAHRPIGSKTVNLVSTTKITAIKKESVAREERPEAAIRGVS